MKTGYRWGIFSFVAFTLCHFTSFASFADGLSPSKNSFSFSELGQKASEKADPGSLGIRAVDNGAEIVCKLQALEASVTPSGISIKSTSKTEGAGTFSMKVAGPGRSGHGLSQTQSDGTVKVSKDCVQIVRPALVEEYTVSGDGIRQDFIVSKKPEGNGELALAVGLSGATSELTDSGLKIRLTETGREFAYSKLLVTDAKGKKLTAEFKINSPTEFIVSVDDSGAVYPIRIDPTISDANWVSMGSSSGFNGSIYALACDHSGNLYAGGDFTYVGPVTANFIAKWDGSAWSALGTGMFGSSYPCVYVLACDSSGNLYAGGKFTKAGGMSVNNIAKWDGSAWTALGTGMNNSVSALAINSSGNLYAGGMFTTAGGLSAKYLARWDGSEWNTLGTGMNSAVSSLVFDSSGNLYAGGWFSTAGEVQANYVAKWNGTEWSALDSGTDNFVSSLAVDPSGKLYAGGWFSTAGGISANYIAKWNGAAWSALGSGMNGNVNTLACNSSGKLYAGGDFTTSGGVSTNYIAKWNGSSWSMLGAGLANGIFALACDSSGNIYANAGKTVCRWNGSDWSSQLGIGLDGNVNALVYDSRGNLYAGGNFITASGITVNSIAKWNGSKWTPLGSGIDGSVTSLAFDPYGNLYAGGQFSTAGGVSANCIAKWNGSKWNPLGSGMDGTVTSLACDSSGKLYAGGSFATAGGVSANYIAKWNGSAWSALGSGIDGYVYVLVCDSSRNLYAGGYFTTAGGIPANNIAKWNGSEWSSLGSGMEGIYNSVYSLACDSSGNLYAGGDFATAGGISANCIAKWNGSAWSSLGSGMEYDYLPSVYTIAVDASGCIYAGGGFYIAGGVSANCIAKWNGSAWNALGSGIGGNVKAIALNSSGTYVGGEFFYAGDKPSEFLAKWITHTCTLSYAPGSNGSIRGAKTQIVKDGKDGTPVTAVPNAGCLFTGWSDGSTDNPRTDTNVTADIKVTANFATVPGAPRTVTAARGNGGATVSFTPPTSDGGLPVTSYIVTSYPEGITATGDSSPIIVGGLKNGTSYTFFVKAKNKVGTGPASWYTPYVIPATVPGAPAIGIPKIGALKITVPFTAPVSNGGSSITGYTLRSNTGIVKFATSSPITVTGLTHGITYTFTVTAENAIGSGAPSAVSIAVTPTAFLPGAPGTVTASPGNTQATVNFTAPVSDGGAPITSYIVTSYPGGVTASGNSSPITVAGLKNGTAYTFYVKAKNAIGPGPASGYSPYVTPATVPDAPTAVTAVRRLGQATINFIPSASNGGSPITQYTATSEPGGITASKATSPITVAGLSPGIAYTFTVTATNAVGTGSPSEASSSPAVAEGRAAVKDIMDETGASSISLALSDENGVVWQEAFGFADKSTGLKTGPETMFCIGSCSKMLATVAAMMLFDRGMISLDEPLTTYIPDFSMLSPEYQDVTVRMILNHSCGFPGTDYRNSETIAPFTGYAAQIMESLKNEHLKHEPGYMNVYCNDGFTMIEILVKNLTGLNFTDFVQQEILPLLEMTHSRYATEVIPDGTYAKGHKGDTPDNYSSFNVYAAGGFYSTPSDMSHLAAMLMNGGVYGSTRILSEEAIAAMAEDQTLDKFNPLPSDEFRYGLGWDSVTQPGMKAVGISAWQKGGDLAAYGATFTVAPDEKLAVTVLAATNTGSSKVNKIAERVLLSALVERGRIAAMPAPLAKNKVLPKMTPSSAEKNACVGYYAMSDLMFRLTFANDNSLNLSLFQKGVWKPWLHGLKLRSDGWYASDSDSVSAVRLFSQEGQRYFGIRQASGAGHYSNNTIYGQKLETRPQISGAWQARLGENWLPFDDGSPAVYPESEDDPRLRLRIWEDLPGYIVAGANALCDVSPTSDSLLDGMTILIPLLNGRDLSDLTAVIRNNREYLLFNSTLHLPASSLEMLVMGRTEVLIAGDNVAEWRKLPATGSLSITGASVWRLFDADFKLLSYGRGDGNAVLPGAGDTTYLMLFGKSGSGITLELAIDR